jgi:peptidoglycan/xylan/chitin deacetylase (PgdA/CDA1 family)
MEVRLSILKRGILMFSKYVGLFTLARMVTRRELRILCYHGFDRLDEHYFRPKLFMTPQTFRCRMALLKRKNYPVLPLGDAVERLYRGDLPAGAVAITIDDGWFGVLTDAAPTLALHDFPATLYLTTYYSETGQPVFDVLIAYLFWCARVDKISLDGLVDGLHGECNLRDAADRADTVHRVVAFGNEYCGVEGRDLIIRGLAVRLGVDYAIVERARGFTLVSLDEARQLHKYGIDLQLHTHRHRFPTDDQEAAMREIDDNRRAMEEIVTVPLVHFCYPSGEHAPHQSAWLEKLGIASATTTEAGLCHTDTNPYMLPRLLDGENVSEIEFEAELSGFTSLLRCWSQKLRSLLRLCVLNSSNKCN